MLETDNWKFNTNNNKTCSIAIENISELSFSYEIEVKELKEEDIVSSNLK
jgi:hypothetical protein